MDMNVYWAGEPQLTAASGGGRRQSKSRVLVTHDYEVTGADNGDRCGQVTRADKRVLHTCDR